MKVTKKIGTGSCESNKPLQETVVAPRPTIGRHKRRGRHLVRQTRKTPVRVQRKSHQRGKRLALPRRFAAPQLAFPAAACQHGSRSISAMRRTARPAAIPRASSKTKTSGGRFPAPPAAKILSHFGIQPEGRGPNLRISVLHISVKQLTRITRRPPRGSSAAHQSHPLRLIRSSSIPTDWPELDGSNRWSNSAPGND
jgi:hypothetical protein